MRDLAAEYGTPAYVLDEDDLRARCRDFAAAFAGADVYYAGKAFLCKAVVRVIAEEGLYLDVCTGGELAVALAAGIPAGADRPARQQQVAVRAGAGRSTPGVGRIVVDSFDEIDRLTALAPRARHAARRCWSGSPSASRRTPTSSSPPPTRTRSSASRWPAARRSRRPSRILDEDVLELRGLHSHIGSQIFDTTGFEVSARRVLELQAQIRDARGVELPELDLGGGFGIAYTTQDDPAPAGDLAKRHEQDRRATSATRPGCAVPRLSVEPGRAIVGPGGVHAVRGRHGQGRRRHPHVRERRRRDERQHPHRAVRRRRTRRRWPAGRRRAEPMLARVVGKHCEAGDIVVKDEFLPADVQPGDLLAVPGTGAYCRSMASNYNHVPRPPVVAVRDGAARVIVRRETEDDLLALGCGMSAS